MTVGDVGGRRFNSMILDEKHIMVNSLSLTHTHTHSLSVCVCVCVIFLVLSYLIVG